MTLTIMVFIINFITISSSSIFILLAAAPTPSLLPIPIAQQSASSPNYATSKSVQQRPMFMLSPEGNDDAIIYWAKPQWEWELDAGVVECVNVTLTSHHLPPSITTNFLLSPDNIRCNQTPMAQQLLLDKGYCLLLAAVATAAFPFPPRNIQVLLLFKNGTEKLVQEVAFPLPMTTNSLPSASAPSNGNEILMAKKHHHGGGGGGGGHPANIITKTVEKMFHTLQSEVGQLRNYMRDMDIDEHTEQRTTRALNGMFSIAEVLFIWLGPMFAGIAAFLAAKLRVNSGNDASSNFGSGENAAADNRDGEHDDLMMTENNTDREPMLVTI